MAVTRIFPSVPATGGSAARGEAATLAALLAVEHAAVYACGAAGGALAVTGPGGRAARALAQAAYIDHARLRDNLMARIGDLGGQPPAARPAYQLPIDPAGVVPALALLAAVEDRTCAAAHDAVGPLTTPADRALVCDTLAGAAVRAQRARRAAGLSPARASGPFPGV
ncbi:MAG: DUF4439 domain-containing protein [Frankia sp.]